MLIIPDGPMQVQPLRGDNFQHGFQTHCPACDSIVRAQFDSQFNLHRREAPCPHCGHDLRVAIQMCLGAEPLNQLRGLPFKLRDAS